MNHQVCDCLWEQDAQDRTVALYSGYGGGGGGNDNSNSAPLLISYFSYMCTYVRTRVTITNLYLC